MKKIIPLALAVCSLFSSPSMAKADEDHHDEIPTQSSSRLTDGKTFGNNPAITATADGTTWVAWVRHYADRGDEVVIAPGKDGEPIIPKKAISS